jgi:hypothetical protein
MARRRGMKTEVHLRIIEQLAAFVRGSSYDNLTMIARQAVNQCVDHRQIVQIECLRSASRERKACGDGWSSIKTEREKVSHDQGQTSL